jgi:type III secretory pathway component EscT
MTRYAFTGVVPSTATQLGVLVTWTPSGTAGTADGVYLNLFQLELGASASPFEKEDVQIILEECQRYAWMTAEPAAGVVVGMGMNTSSAAQLVYMATPVQFFKAPTVTVAAGSFKTNQAGTATATTITPGSTHTPNAISINGSSTGTAGQAAALIGGGGSGWILASADF